MTAHTLKDAIRTTRRRIVIDRMLRLTGLCLSGALLLAGIVLLVDRAWSLNVPVVLYAALLAIGLLAGPLLALWRVPATLDIAVHLDRQLNLQDQLGSAVAAKDLPPLRREPAFSALLLRAADHLAGRIDLRAASPVRITRIWLVAILLGGLFGTGLPLLPDNWIGRVDAATQLAQQDQEQAQQQREELAASLEDTIDDLRASDDLLDAQTQEDLEALEQLASQLAGDDAAPDLDPLQAQAEATQKLNEVADRLQQQVQRDQAAADELVQRFRQLPEPDTATDQRFTDELTDALRRGDLSRAADALDTALEQAQRLPPEQRDQVIDNLRDLADRINDTADTTDPQSDAQWDLLRDALRDQGLDEQAIDDLLSEAGAPPRQEPADPTPPTPDAGTTDNEPPAPDDTATPPPGETDAPADDASTDAPSDPDPPRNETDPPAPPADQTPPPASEQPEQAIPDRPEPSPQTPPTDEPASPDAQPSDAQEPPQGTEQSGDQTQQSPQGDRPAPTADEIQRDLQEQGVEEDTARRLAEDIEQQQQQQQAEDQAREDAQRIADAVDKAADQLQQPQPDPNAPDAQPQETPQQDPNAPDAQPETAQPTQQPTQPPAQQPQQGEQPQGQPQSDPTQQPQQGEQPQGQPQPDPTQQPQQGEQPQGQPQPDPAQQPQQGTPPQGDPTSTPQGPSDPAQPGQQPPGQPTGAPRPSTPPDATGNPAPAPDTTGSSSPRPGDRIREVFRDNQDNERLRDTIQRTRDGANDLGQDPPGDKQDRWRPSPSDPMNPDQPQGLGPTAGDGAGDPTLNPDGTGTPSPQTEDVDIRGDETGDQTIAEWFDPNNTPRPDGTVTQPRPDAQGRVRQAREMAERAVDNSAVPRRYHDMIRAYFNRLQELAEPSGTAGEAPAAP